MRPSSYASRVNYREENWVALTELLHEDSNVTYFSRLTRAQLLDDSFNLARAGQLDYEIPLNMSTYLKDNIEDYIPLKVKSWLESDYHDLVKLITVHSYLIRSLS